MSAAEEQADPRIGRILCEKYRIVRKIGNGGMGEVYEAEQLSLQKKVAIKFLSQSRPPTKELRARFAEEARTGARFASDHIADTIDFGSVDDVDYLVMEYLDGRPLEEVISEEPPLGINRVVDILRQACLGVAAVHAKGVVHRDLKPSNLFLVHRDGSELCKIIDFGIAKLKNKSSGFTKTGVVPGTPQYVSPERFKSEELDARSDIFALGAILYEALTGRTAFDGDEPHAIMHRVLTAEPRPVRSLRADVPSGLAAVIEKALAKSADDRFQSVAELRDALAPFGTPDRFSITAAQRETAPDVNATTLPGLPPLVTTTPKRASHLQLMPVAVLLVGFGALGCWLLMKQPERALDVRPPPPNSAAAGVSAPAAISPPPAPASAVTISANREPAPAPASSDKRTSDRTPRTISGNTRHGTPTPIPASKTPAAITSPEPPKAAEAPPDHEPSGPFEMNNPY